MASLGLYGVSISTIPLRRGDEPVVRTPELCLHKYVAGYLLHESPSRCRSAVLALIKILNAIAIKDLADL